MGEGVSRRVLIVKVSLAVLGAGAMLAGSYALVGSGDNFAVGGDGPSREKVEHVVPIKGAVVSDVTNTPELDAGVMVVTVPLGVNFEVPGALYGTKAKKPVQLGPKGVKGMTQDEFGSQAGMLLPDGQRVLYHFSEQMAPFPTYAPGSPEVADGTPMSRPSIRLLDLTSGEDSEVVQGARSMAWRADGTFAYARGVDAEYRLNVPYLQHVIVQSGLDGAPEVWTPEPGNYTVLQWVDDALLVALQHEGETSEILVLEGPGMHRQVVSAAERFLCTSPEGDRLLLSSGGSDPRTDPAIVRVIELETGREVARMSLEGVLDPTTGTPVTQVGAGAWEDDTIVLALTPADLAVLRADGESLTLKDVFTFTYPSVRHGTVGELLLKETGDKVYFVTREGSDAVELERTAVIAFDLVSGECTRWTVPGMRATTRLVGNTSRPR